MVVEERKSSEAQQGSKGRLSLAHGMPSVLEGLSNARPRLHQNVRSMMPILRRTGERDRCTVHLLGLPRAEETCGDDPRAVGVLKCTMNS